MDASERRAAAAYSLALVDRLLEAADDGQAEENVAAAVGLLEDAAGSLTPRDDYDLWKALVYRLALLYLMGPKGASAEGVEKAVRLGRESAAVDPRGEIDEFMSGLFLSLGDIQTAPPAEGEDGADPAALGQAITYYKHALEFADPDEQPGTCAVLHLKLAMFYQGRWRAAGAARRECAAQVLHHAQQAETFFTEQRAPKEWGMIQFLLGTTYMVLGEGNQEDAALLALSHMEAALRSPLLSENPEMEVPARVTLALWQMYAPGKTTEEIRRDIDAHVNRAAQLAPPEARGFLDSVKAAAYAAQTMRSNPKVGKEDAAAIISQLQNAVGILSQGGGADTARSLVPLQIVLWHAEVMEETLAAIKEEEPGPQEELYAGITDGKHSLAAALIRRRRPDLLGRGWELTEQAIETYLDLIGRAADPGEWAQLNVELANVYTVRKEYFADRADPAETRRLELHFTSQAMPVLLDGGMRVLSRFMAGRAAGLLTFFREGRWREAEQLLGVALDAVEEEYESSLGEGSESGALRRGGGLALSLVLNQAYTKARLDKPAEAAELLEKWRGKQLAEALQWADGLSGRVREEDRRELAETSARIEGLRQAAPQGQDYATHAKELRRLQGRRQEILTRIRSYLPDYLRDINFEEIRQVAEPDKPLAYVLCTEAGSLILVVPHVGEPACLWSDELTKGRLGSLLYYHLLPLLDGFSFKRMSEFLGGRLPRTAGAVVGLLREHLRRTGARGVYLVPCGALAVLPLHATADPQRRCLIDDFEVHYVPNARTLRAARGRLDEGRAGDPKLVAVGNPTGDLRAASFEAQGVAKLFSPLPSLVLTEGAATYEALVDALPSATHLHLACHGRTDMENPLASALLLAAGRQLSLKAVIDGPAFGALKGARLVVLSACQTALVEVENLPEEVLGLHTGFLQAGVPGVVGTLWSVNDLSTAYLMLKFYQNLLPPRNLKPAAALREAQLWLRDVTRDEVEAFSRSFGLHRGGGRAAREADLQQTDEPDPTGRPFADPYFWAGFTFVGL